MSAARHGISVFPANPDKTPMVAAWEQKATSSQFMIGATWKTDALPAIPVGANGLVVVDADRKPDGVDGVAAFEALCAAQGIDVSTALTVETPSGGRHFYFRTDTPYSNSRGNLPDGIDVRGVGGYCVAPGAVLPDGRSYRLMAGSWDAIPGLPEPLARLLREKRSAAPPEAASEPVTFTGTDAERNYAEAALEDEVAKLSVMGEGSGRNHALNSAAHSLGTMAAWIDPSRVANALWEASIANGYIAKDGEATARQTIESGINAGMSKPRPSHPT
ncbi:bifunctional DNA primase/polymerase, partial [Acidicapsa acidisoli]|uniref:bifunctional DNA primase/polymerase n=1 Tax=Acidicapsa acidisoli TaxID=1615681 RepID=UPI0021E02089